jgi:plastocyanin
MKRGTVTWLAAGSVAALIAIASLSGALSGCSKSSSGSVPTAPSPPPPGKFDSGALPLGASYVVTFNNTGTVGYHCIPHQLQNMKGTVDVNSSGADSAVVQVGPGNSLTFSPSSVSVKPGKYVRWVNVSNMAIHTVTQD